MLPLFIHMIQYCIYFLFFSLGTVTFSPSSLMTFLHLLVFLFCFTEDLFLFLYLLSFVWQNEKREQKMTYFYKHFCFYTLCTNIYTQRLVFVSTYIYTHLHLTSHSHFSLTHTHTHTHTFVFNIRFLWVNKVHYVDRQLALAR